MTEWWNALQSIEKVFVILAFPFSVLTLLQLIIEIFGFGGDSGGSDADVDHGGGMDGGGESFGDHFHFFSVRNMIYFLMMFGWTGLACSKSHIPVLITIPLALIAGILTTVILGWIFYFFSKLQESGNVSLHNSVGHNGKVYIAIPEKRQGTGVIQINLQGLTQEYDAITDGDKLNTGASIQVIEVINSNTVLVVDSGDYSVNM